MIHICKYFLLFILAAFVCSSCQTSKKLHQQRLYLQGIDSLLQTRVTPPDPVIQKGEKLAITVYSDNTEASAPFNLGQVQAAGGTTVAQGMAANSTPGYLVDADGNVLMAGLGPVHAEGLTKQQFKQALQEKLATYLKKPYVEIKFLSKRVTILGEIAKPGIIDMPEDRLNILDAIALSGDMTSFSRNDNILVIREENGNRTMGRLNIKDPNIYKSDYFYLHRGDIVYVEPTRKKPTGTDQTLLRNISIAATIASTLAIVYSVLKR